MIIVLSILSVALLGVIIYFAISPKSSRLLRMAAIIALSVIGLSLLICGFFIIRGPAQDPQAVPFPVLADTQAPERKGHIADLIILAVLIAVVSFVIFMATRKKPGKAQPAAKTAVSSVFQDGDDLGIDLNDEPGEKENDESFDIKIE